MTEYFIRRFLLLVPTFLGATIVVFTILQLAPGGPLEQAIMQVKMGAAAQGEVGGAGGGDLVGGVEIPAEALAEMRKFYGFDRPIWQRYLIWLGVYPRAEDSGGRRYSGLLTGDLGTSFVYAESVWDVIRPRFQISLFFGMISLVLHYVVCVPLGIVKALKHGSKFDLLSSSLVFLGYSIPGWAVGAVLLVLTGGGSFWDIFPLGGFRSEGWDEMNLGQKILDQANHAVLPVIAYTIGAFATLTVLMKNSLLENLSQDYVRTAFAKGLNEKRVIWLHTMRNSLIPVATGFGHAIGILIAGSYLVERTFNINGFGMLGFQSVLARDYPVIMGVLVLGVLLRLVGNILSDICVATVDPRIRFK